MGHTTFYCAGSTSALQIAAELLRKSGIPVARVPDGSVTDLLLDIPSFDNSGNLRSGEEPEALFSRLPHTYEDCCTVFLPKHPTTKPKLDRILESEIHLDVDGLIAAAVESEEIVHITQK